MSSLRSRILLLSLLTLLTLTLAGCGSKNAQSSYTPTSGGAHTTAGWLPAVHATTAEANINACAECHGADYAGGTSKVACTECHMGDQQNVHPLSWGYQAYSAHATYVGTNGTTACSNVYCHGTKLTGVTSSGASCSSCHLGGASHIHPYDSTLDATTNFNNWASTTTSTNFHGTYVTNNGVNSCENAVCHGTDLGGVTGSGQSCQACHANYTYFRSSTTRK
jgi:hypothetical protein